MAAKLQKQIRFSTAYLLLVLITFPFWIGFSDWPLASVAGVMGAVFGTIFGTIGHLPGAFFRDDHVASRAIFGHAGWFLHVNGYSIAVIVILIVLIPEKQKQRLDIEG